jgi:glycosyltransferase involved in cell wall biosynthesis
VTGERSAQHILFVAAYFPPYAPGGAEHSTEALALALQERGQRITVAAPSLGPLRNETLPVITFRAGLRLRHGQELLRTRVFLRPDVQLRLAIGYGRAVRASGATIVHCQNLVVLPAAWLAARLHRLPLVVTVRDLGAVCPLTVCLLSRKRVPHDCGPWRLQRRCVGEYSRAYRTARARTAVSSLAGFATARLGARLLRDADARIFVGSDLVGLHRDAGLLTAGASVHVSGNIASATELGKPGADGANGAHEGGEYAVYAGKISVGKGLGVLLDAVPLILERCGDFRLLVFGRADESWHPRLEETPGVEYRGSVSRSQVIAAYHGARLAVVPSIWPEPLARTVLEALAAGVPLVATRSGGIGDAVTDGDEGLLVEPSDPESLAAAVARLWDDAALRSRLAQNARESVARRFSADAVCARTVAAYEEALVAHAARSRA